MNHDLNQLQEKIKLATLDARAWDEVCEEITCLFGATGTLLPASNPNFRGLWTAGSKRIKEAMAIYLEEDWITGDPREPVLITMFERGYCTDDEIFPDRADRFMMPIYRDFLLPWDFGNVCMIRLATPEGYWPMTVHFSNDHPSLSDTDLSLVHSIQRLFEEATWKASEIAYQRIYSFFEFMEGSNTEVYVFDADGTQSFTIDQSGKIQSRNDLERLLPSEITSTISDELKEALLSDPNMSISRAYQFTKHDKNVNVLIIQIPPSLRHFFMKFKTCAVRTELGDTSAFKRKCLKRDFKLTDAEIITVEMLAAGSTPAVIADMLGLKPTSIRQRLKDIYEKASINSQLELVALYGRL